MLRICPDCHSQISASARTCPRCGKPLNPDEYMRKYRERKEKDDKLKKKILPILFWTMIIVFFGIPSLALTVVSLLYGLAKYYPIIPIVSSIICVIVFATSIVMIVRQINKNKTM